MTEDVKVFDYWFDQGLSHLEGVPAGMTGIARVCPADATKAGAQMVLQV